MRLIDRLRRPRNERRRILENQRVLLEMVQNLGEKFESLPEIHAMSRPAPVYLGNETVLTETFFGRKIFVDGSDTSLTPHLIREGRWEPELTAFLMDNLKPGLTFIDIGANCGFYSLLAAHMVGHTGRVVAIEPQEKLCKLIRRSIYANGFDGFARSTPVAIGKTAGKAALAKNEFLSGSASLVGLDASEDSVEEVRVVSLSDALAQVQQVAQWPDAITPDVVKIDCEGFEWMIWQGAADLFAACDKLLIFLEFSPARYFELGDAPEAFVEKMAADGFSISVTGADGAEKALSKSDLLQICKPDHGQEDLILRKG
jgi:FkbM family methyltransferase